jgi:CRISPR-associated endonuclease Cas1
MLQTAVVADTENPDSWTERSEYWLSIADGATRHSKRSEDNNAPLILNGHGVSMRVEKGALVIRDGFTHYPQTQSEYRFWPGQPALPARILLLDGSGTLSFDVLSWLAMQSIPLARVKWNGEIATVASGSGFVGDAEKIRWQLETRADPVKRLEFAAALIAQKLAASIDTLTTHFSPEREVRIAISQAGRSISILQKKQFTDLREIMGIEGSCANTYFNAWQTITYDWKGIGKHPIPGDWYEVRGRTGRTKGRGPTNRNATHPINALLNYAYAVRSAQLQLELIAQGYDPSVGLLHETQAGRSSYVLDMIEPLRPVVDAKILFMLKYHKLDSTDFIVRSDGVCRLSPQLARAVAALIK